MTGLPQTAEVVVVGCGAIGAAVAYTLARDGHDVVVCERGKVGMGASAGTACMVTVSHAERMASPVALGEGLRFLGDPTGPLALRPRPRVVPWLARFTAASLRSAPARDGTTVLRRLAQEGLERHRAWSEELDTGLVERGTLNAYVTAAGLETRAAVVAEQSAAGLEPALLDPRQVLELEPALRDVRGGVLHPGDAHVDSLRFCERVAAGAAARGARIAQGVEVLAVHRGPGNLRIDTTGGSIAAKRLVLAAGIWSRRLAADVGALLPLTPAKGYHVELEGIGPVVSRPVYLFERRVVATPVDGRLRLAGTLEIGTDPEAVDARRVEAVLRAGRQHLDGVAGARVAHVWRGLRPLSADGLPIVGRSPADDRILLAVGHGTLGITLAPVTAEHVAVLAGGEELPETLALLRPERFRRLGLRSW